MFFKLFDRDVFKGDDLIGTGSLRVQDILKGSKETVEIPLFEGLKDVDTPFLFKSTSSAYFELANFGSDPSDETVSPKLKGITNDLLSLINLKVASVLSQKYAILIYHDKPH